MSDKRLGWFRILAPPLLPGVGSAAPRYHLNERSYLMITTSRRAPILATLSAAAIAASACADPVSPESATHPAFAVGDVVSPVLTRGEVILCVNGSDGDFTVGATAVAVSNGTCKTVAFGNGAIQYAAITQLLPAGTVVTQIDTLVGLAASNKTFPQTTSAGSYTDGRTSVNVPYGLEWGTIVTYHNRVEQTGGGQGCTPGYWKQRHHFDSWTAPYTPTTQFGAVFANAFPGMTLVQVASQGGGGLKALGRHTVAALLNAASSGVNYGMTTTEVIAAFNAAYASGDYTTQKNVFERMNESGCPLN